VTYQAQEAETSWNHAPFHYYHKQKKTLVGTDVFLAAQPKEVDGFCEKLAALQGPLKLITIVNRGLKVWPNRLPGADYCDVWSCRFQRDEKFFQVTQSEILAQLQVLEQAGYEIVKLENLYCYDGERGFSLAQGQ
jgi:isocitrate dehydrogenase